MTPEDLLATIESLPVGSSLSIANSGAAFAATYSIRGPNFRWQNFRATNADATTAIVTAVDLGTQNGG